MTHVALIHWNNAEAVEKAHILEQAGYDVALFTSLTREQMITIREGPPDIFVIDLSRLPSQGQAFAIWLRQQKNTRGVPIVFTGGLPEKIERAHQVLPDIPAVDWQNIINVLQYAIDHPLLTPIVPGTFDSYSGTPLPKKLGIRKGSSVALLGAPPEMEQVLEPLPAGCTLTRTDNPSIIQPLPNIILLFSQSKAELKQTFPGAAQSLAQGGRIWIIWPKKKAGIPSDLNERSVRTFGMDSGFVDYKISSIDQTWSGLCFARRQAAK